MSGSITTLNRANNHGSGVSQPQLPLGPPGERQMPGFLSKIQNPIMGAWQASSCSAKDSCMGWSHQSFQSGRVIDHIGDPDLVMNPTSDNLKPTKPPEAPIYQSGAGSPLRGAMANILAKGVRSSLLVFAIIYRNYSVLSRFCRATVLCTQENIRVMSSLVLHNADNPLSDFHRFQAQTLQHLT